MASLQSYFLRFLLKRTVNWNKPLNEVRDFHRSVQTKEVVPGGITIKKIDSPNFNAEWFVPQGVNFSQTLVYIHGGGYCLGVVDANRNFVLMLAKFLQQPIILLDYPLAPENPFPAALSHSVSLYEWLLKEAKFLPSNIGYIADSSGCGLTLATFQETKVRGLGLPKFQVFMSPVVDLTLSGKSFVEKTKKDPFSLKKGFFIDDNYIQGNDPANPKFSPIFGNLLLMPSTLIQASEYDVFLSDSEMLAAKLKDAGVDVSYSLWKKLWHNFQMSYTLLPEGKRALNEIRCFVSSYFTA